MATLLKVYGFSSQDNGCGFYRDWQHLAALKELGLAEVLREPDKPGGLSGDKAKDIFDWADVVFAQPSSELWASALLISARNHSGKKLVVDLDDHIWAVHPMNVADVNG